MENVDPNVFQVLWDWMYVRTVAAHYNTAFEDDYFWYLVFKMSKELGVPELVLTAYQRFQTCFRSSLDYDRPDQGRLTPSDSLLWDLLYSPTTELVFKDFIATHILWHSLYGTGVSNAIQRLQAQHPGLATQVGQLLPKSKHSKPLIMPESQSSHTLILI